MDKTKRLRIKLIAIMIGVILFILLLLSGIGTAIERAEEKEGITIREASLLLRVLCEDSAVSFQETGEEGELTYGQFETMTEALDRTNVTLPEDYRKNQVISKEDFYTVYEKWITYYGLEDLIRTENFFVLTDNAATQEGENGNEAVLFTEKGVWKNGTADQKSHLYRRIEGIVREDVLLAVKEEKEEAYLLKNVWVMEANENRLKCFYNDAVFDIPYQEEAEREQVSDLQFGGNGVSGISVKKEKITGKILSADQDSIEIEGCGVYEFTEDVKIYKLYGQLQRYYLSDLKIGYDFADFILEDGKVCTGLVTKDEKMENIRVLIQKSDYTGRFHEQIEITSDVAYTVQYGGETEQKAGGEVLLVDMGSDCFAKDSRILVTPEALTGRITLNSVHRNQGTPSYRGSMEIRRTEDGLVLINELLLEEYLYAVVPSEMPASYPKEALKAQAICARTYAYRNMETAGLSAYGAHVDDSTTYQVYNNISENAETSLAVRETQGELLYRKEKPAETFYYSTSCGYGTDTSAWQADAAGEEGENPKRISLEADGYTPKQMAEEENFDTYISQSSEDDYEREEGFYRWTYEVKEIKEELLLQRLKERYAIDGSRILTKTADGYAEKPIEELGHIRDIYVDKRNTGGVISSLIIEGSKNTFQIQTESNVRYILNDSSCKVKKQDGTEVSMPTLLPSAFFRIIPSKNGENVVGYRLVGGGFGHGIGMSQNGAKGMAYAGMNSEEILTFFYEGSTVKSAY